MNPAKPKPPQSEWLISIGAAASLLGCSVRHVHRMVKDGRLTSYRLSELGHHRFRVGDVRALIISNAELGDVAAALTSSSTFTPSGGA